MAGEQPSTVTVGFFYGGVHASYRVPWLTTVPKVTNINRDGGLIKFRRDDGISSPYKKN